ncbi:hypothetical protein BTI_2218 [Burkholderia thailandensis MSMB121]|uniref:class I SAM-dependent methyltransferase n=2 Tax=Burkholderia humptydooensis TaxID=430531 RepID=UPI0003281150|nr:class I SAM-dependent methyltransferase [Burkholderia humptydooensis]AGK47462.1 hypothetical protein BTI_2218 [Burkholderia thailandensis MSMB121]ATF37222.1 class I SAM-dependent methyltransferase [Burkholderia thailandensis]KST74596.1 hypothetical protein WS76_10800 [Burkholderia humptydooensis]
MARDSEFLEECKAAPRLHSMADFFANTAAGRGGMPRKPPTVDERLFEGDVTLKRFADLHRRRWGHFDLHYHASIPYRLEEEIRLGEAILSYGMQAARPGEPFKVYSLGTAEGTMARTMSELANGAIETLSSSATRENRDSFYRYGEPPHARFFLGAFHELDRTVLDRDSELRPFASGFDVILEDTTFQMVSPNRMQQIAFVAQVLKPGGLFVFVEKFLDDDRDAYMERERQKDFGFKTRFFDRADIERKQRDILDTMNRNEVSLSDMARAIAQTFAHAAVTWNSGNFSTLVASERPQAIQAFIARMTAPCIPREYEYESVPRALCGLQGAALHFRAPNRLWSFVRDG